MLNTSYLSSSPPLGTDTINDLTALFAIDIDNLNHGRMHALLIRAQRSGLVSNHYTTNLIRFHTRDDADHLGSAQPALCSDATCNFLYPVYARDHITTVQIRHIHVDSVLPDFRRTVSEKFKGKEPHLPYCSPGEGSKDTCSLLARKMSHGETHLH